MKNRICYAIALILALFVSLAACSKSSDEEVTHAENTVAEEGKVWVEGFEPLSSMNVKRTGAAGVTVNGYIYIFGGVDGDDFLNSTERAKINPDGTLGEWVMMEPLNEKRGFFYAHEYNGFIYVIGGGQGPHGQILLASAERTKINSDGTLQPWVIEKNYMMSPRRCSKTKLINGAIYAVGGFNGGFLEYVDRTGINPDGTLGQWILDDNPTTVGRYIHALAKVGKKIYVIAGHNEHTGTGLDDVEWTTVNPDGSLKKWQKDKNTLLHRRYGHSAFTNNNFMYAAGGVDGPYLSSIEFTRIDASGKIGEWRYTTPLNEPRESAVSLAHNNNLYIIGGSNAQGFKNSVMRAVIKKDGNLGYWTDKSGAEQLIEKKEAVLFKDILIMSANLNEYFNEGKSYLNSKIYDMAEVAYQKVIAINPYFMDTYQNLSAVYIRSKRYDDAIAALDKAIAKKKDYPYSYYNKACVYALQNKTDLAISSLFTAIEHGYNDLEAIETDPDLNNIRNSPRYRKVIREVIMKN